MKLICLLGDLGAQVVEVLPNDPLYSLLQKLDISDKTTFIFEGRTFCVSSILTFSEIGINKDCNLFFMNPAISGGCGSEYSKFANLSDEFISKIDVSRNNPNIPKWRTVGKGINLHGICLNKNCVANGKEVTRHIKSKEYNIINEGFMGICPMCNKHFDLDTCSFYKCDYKVEGTYFDKFIDDWVDLPDKIQKTSGGKVFYYDYKKEISGKEGKVRYKRLILKVFNYHDYE